MGKTANKGEHKASATVKTTKTNKSVAATSHGGSGIAAGRHARIEGASRGTAVAAGQDVDICFAPAIPSALAGEIRQKLRELQAHADAVSEPEDREEAKLMVVRVQEQLTKPKPQIERIKRYLAVLSVLVTASSHTIDALTDVLNRIRAFVEP